MHVRMLRFLEQRCDFSRPILVALSGGPDSVALLYMLLECAKALPLKIGIAHVDHGWRKQSAWEASTLRALATQLNLPFHLKVLNPMQLSGNLENACRQLRYAFFSQLAEEHRYQAVLVGHHQDDLSETVLKRVFEGASLINLKGIQADTEICQIPVWRPLLEVSKEAILRWLKERAISSFEDSTNLDVRFLRGRLRSVVLPFLTKEFGKEVKGSLIHLSKEAEELGDFLKQHLQVYLEGIIESPLGLMLDLSEKIPVSLFELKQLLRYFFEREGVHLGRAQLSTALQLVREKKGNKQLRIDQKTVYFDRARLFIERNPLAANGVLQRLDASLSEYASWKVTWSPMAEKPVEAVCGTSWKEVWNGNFWMILPIGDYHLGPPCVKKEYPRSSSLDKWWTAHRVPAFLRSKVPVVWQENRIFHEFLSGKMNAFHGKVKQWAKVTFEYAQRHPSSNL